MLGSDVDQDGVLVGCQLDREGKALGNRYIQNIGRRVQPRRKERGLRWTNHHCAARFNKSKQALPLRSSQANIPNAMVAIQVASPSVVNEDDVEVADKEFSVRGLLSRNYEDGAKSSMDLNGGGLEVSTLQQGDTMVTY